MRKKVTTSTLRRIVRALKTDQFDYGVFVILGPLIIPTKKTIVLRGLRDLTDAHTFDVVQTGQFLQIRYRTTSP